MILGIFTGLTEYGGIQCYGCQAATVIATVAQSRGERYLLFGLNDPVGWQEIEIAGVRVSIFGFGRRKAAIMRAILTQARLTRMAYFNHPNLAPLGLALRALNPAMRYVVSTYGAEVWDPLSRLRRLALGRATRVTAIAKFSGEKVASVQGVATGKIAIVPCALDPEFVRVSGAARRSRCPDGPPILLTVARLESPERGELKGIDTVIEALPAVLEAFSDLRYVVVGDGDDRPRLERLVHEKGVDSVVRFTGAVDAATLRLYYEACEIFVMPSRTEGFGIVFLEAMVFGKPVIGGNYGGTPEIWADGTAGFLVDHGDLQTLANRLKLLLDNSDLRTRMGAEGRRLATDMFSFDRFRQNFAPLFA